MRRNSQKKIFKILRKSASSAEENIPQSTQRYAENANKLLRKSASSAGETNLHNQRHQHSEKSNFLQNQIATLILLILNTNKMNLKITATKCLSLMMVAGLLTITSCVENKKHNEDQDEKTEQKDERHEKAETSNEDNENETENSKNVDVASLPQSVRDYVNTNFGGYTIGSADHDPMCTGEDAIEVVIKKANATDYALIFSPDWKFIQLEEDVDFSVAPAIINDVLKKDFADYTASKQIEKLTMADKSTHFLVDVTKGKTSKEVIFDDQGKVVCVSK